MQAFTESSLVPLASTAIRGANLCPKILHLRSINHICTSDLKNLCRFIYNFYFLSAEGTPFHYIDFISFAEYKLVCVWLKPEHALPSRHSCFTAELYAF